MPTSVVFALPPLLDLCVRPKEVCHINGMDGISPHLCSSLVISGYTGYMASFMPRARSSLSFSTIFALSQSMTWFSFTEWSVRDEPHISLCLFPVSCIHNCFTDFLCLRSVLLITRTFSFLYVSPINLSQPLQSVVYTPSLESVLSLG